MLLQSLHGRAMHQKNIEIFLSYSGKDSFEARPCTHKTQLDVRFDPEATELLRQNIAMRQERTFHARRRTR